MASDDEKIDKDKSNLIPFSIRNIMKWTWLMETECNEVDNTWKGDQSY